MFCWRHNDFVDLEWVKRYIENKVTHLAEQKLVVGGKRGEKKKKKGEE